MNLLKIIFTILVLVFINSLFNRPPADRELLELEKKKSRVSSFMGLGLAATALISSFLYSRNAPLPPTQKVSLIANVFKNMTEALVLLRTFLIPGFSVRTPG